MPSVPVRFNKNRYAQFGGIDAIIDDLIRHNTSYNKIAQNLGISRESVRKDIIKYLGKKKYSDFVESRRPKPVADEILPPREAILRLKAEGLASKIPKLINVSAVIHTALTSGVEITVTRSPSGTYKYFINNRSISIRTGISRKTLREYSIGYYRFNIHLSHDYPFRYIVFSVFNEDPKQPPNAIYIFRRAELLNIRSLNLQFDRLSRRSKWKYALNRWEILK